MTNSINEQWTPTVRFPKRVIILGNDTVAWMTAALLTQNFDALNIRTTVCSGGAPHFAGETFTSSSALTGLFRNMGVDEHDVMKACQGTYRLGTQFSDWAAEGRDFWQPLGYEHINIDRHSLFDIWSTERIAGRLLRPLHSYSPHWTACLAGKAPHSFSGTSAIGDSGQYGFHGDACGLADWFRAQALLAGAEEMAGDIDRVFPNGRGGIAQVKLQSGQPVPGDFFIDCRPPTKITEHEFIDLSDRFLCDRSVTFSSPSQRQVQPFTRVTAHDCGWSNTTPLAGEVRHRYAFSGSLQSDENALRCLRDSVSSRSDQPLDAEPAAVFADVRHYCRAAAWKDNVVHLGRSSYRLEPLASTDMHLDLAGVELLLELFPDRSVGRATRSEFNARMTAIVKENQSLVQLHHTLTNHSDTPYRRAAVVAASTADVVEMQAVYNTTGMIRVRNPESPAAAQYHGLMAGCSRLPRRPTLATTGMDPGRTQQVLRDIVKQNEAIVKDLSLHEELLDWIHTGPFQQKVG